MKSIVYFIRLAKALNAYYGGYSQHEVAENALNYYHAFKNDNADVISYVNELIENMGG